MGAKTTVSYDNSVALGSESVTSTAVATSTAIVGQLTFNGFAGTSPNSIVSVGSSNVKRTITNVAAGQVTSSFTDAINGSQLYAVASSLSNVANSVKSVLGSEFNLSLNGTITATNIASTGKTTVSEAIAASRSVVKAGTNIANVASSTASGPRQVKSNGVDAQMIISTSIVDFVNGTGTTANVTTSVDATTVRFNVNSANVTKKANGTVTVIDGGNTFISGDTFASTINSIVVSDGLGNLNIKLARNLTNLSSAQFEDTVGKTKIDTNVVTISSSTGNASTEVSANGVMVTSGQNVAYRSTTETSFVNTNGSTVTLSANGLDNGGATITNVVSGVNDTDAVKVG